MNLKYVLILTILVAAGSAALTRYYFPRIETKETEVTKEVVKTDIKTIIKTIEHPDGTKETTETIVDKSIKHETNIKESIVMAKKEWFIGIGADTKLTEFKPIYSLQVNKRILGPFYGGMSGRTDGSIGVILGSEF